MTSLNTKPSLLLFHYYILDKHNDYVCMGIIFNRIKIKRMSFKILCLYYYPKIPTVYKLSTNSDNLVLGLLLFPGQLH